MSQADLEERRNREVVVKWGGFAMQIALLLLTAGVLWGALDGRLKLIEYRLAQIERTLHIGVGGSAGQ